MPLEFMPIIVQPRTEAGALSPTWLRVARVVSHRRGYEVAQHLGVGSAQLSRMENGRDPINAKYEKRFLQLYGK